MPKPKNKGNNLKKLKKSGKKPNINNAPNLNAPKVKSLVGKRKRDEEEEDIDVLQIAEGNNYSDIQNDNQVKRMKKKAKRKNDSEEVDHFSGKLQIRQRVTHRRTIYLLEQLMLKNGFQNQYPNAVVKEVTHGIDIYFFKSHHITKFNAFLESVLPVNIKRLSGDDNNASVFSAELAPVCVGDVICLPQRLHSSMGGLGPILVVYKIDANIYVIDPQTLEAGELTSFHYFNKDKPFKCLFSSQQLIEYTVIDVDDDKIDNETRIKNGGYTLGGVQVSKTSEMGQTDSIVHTKTHLFSELEVGDVVYGYDMNAANTSDDSLDTYKNAVLPDVVLIKKKYELPPKRIWMLMRLFSESDDGFEEFLEDLETDKKTRSRITLYRDPNVTNVDEEMNEPEKEKKQPKKKQSENSVRLEELFDALGV